MVKVRALQKCFIGNVLRDEDEVFNYHGEPCPTVLIEVDAENREVEMPTLSNADRGKIANEKAREVEDLEAEAEATLARVRKRAVTGTKSSRKSKPKSQ